MLSTGMDALTRIRTTRGLSAKIAAELKLSSGTISQWSQVPVHHIETVERITGIPREQLRPDLAKMFGAEPTKRSAATAEQAAA